MRMMKSDHPASNALMAFVTRADEAAPRNAPPIHEASRLKKFGDLKRLLEEGADVNELNENSLTPLYWCCVSGSVEMAKLLINRGTDVDLVDTNMTGLSQLETVQMMDYTELAELLLANGAHI
jgi:ankyrin repeat protein